MKLNRNEHSCFIQWLDRAAEKNPLLWLPCILLIALALAMEHTAEYLKIVYSHRNTEKIVKEKPQLVRKPFVLRAVAMSLVVAFNFMLISEFSSITVFAEYEQAGFENNTNLANDDYAINNELNLDYTENNLSEYDMNTYDNINGSFDNVTWEYNDGIITFYGSGELRNVYNDGDVNWQDYTNEIRKIVFAGNFDSVYIGVSFPILEKIDVTGTVIEIKDASFNDCCALNKVTLNGTQYIRSRAFDGCTNLISIDFPNTLLSIDDRAFMNCPLNSITFNEGLKNIGIRAFYQCSLSGQLTIPSSVQNINTGAFAENKITELWLKNGLINIESEAFANCDQLTDIILPDSLISVGERAFYHCSSLKSVVFGKNIQSISNDAFYYADNLEVIGGYHNTALDEYAANNTNGNVTFSWLGDGSSGIIDSGSDSGVTWTYNTDKILEFSGNGIIAENGNRSYEKYLSTATSIKINEGITGIDEKAFYDPNSKVTGNLDIPEGVEFINKGALVNLKISELILPSSITYFDLSECYESWLNGSQYIDEKTALSPTLTDIIVSSSNIVFSSVNGILYSDDQKELLFYPRGRVTDEYIIPEGVESIGYRAIGFNILDLQYKCNIK